MASISDFTKSNTPEIKENKAPETPSEPPTTAPATVSPRPQASQAAPSADEITNSILSKIADIGVNNPLKFMLFGEPGSTKSSFTATAKNNLIVDFEEGLMSAKHSPNGIGEGTKSFPYKSFDEFVQLIKLVRENHPSLANFETFSIDTFSDLHKRGLAEITEREWRKRPQSLNRYVPEIEHHTENNERMLRILRALRDIDRHLIITAHAKTVEPKNRPSKTYADFSESLSNKIMAMMDIVGYMEMRKIDGKIIPVMRVVGNGIIQAKTRINLPEEIANPTFPKILKAWENSKL